MNGQRQYGTYLTGTDVVCDTGIVFGKWHHVAVTCNHGTKKLQFYINGVLKKESTLSGAFADEATDILIGIHKNMEQSGALKGSLDELRYYNKVVSADTIAALYDEFKLPEEEKEPILITVDPSEEVRDISRRCLASITGTITMDTAPGMPQNRRWRSSLPSMRRKRRLVRYAIREEPCPICLTGSVQRPAEQRKKTIQEIPARRLRRISVWTRQ